jgi:hypothetical protein
MVNLLRVARVFLVIAQFAAVGAQRLVQGRKVPTMANQGYNPLVAIQMALSGQI